MFLAPPYRHWHRKAGGLGPLATPALPRAWVATAAGQRCLVHAVVLTLAIAVAGLTVFA